MALRDVSLVCIQIVKWSILESDFSVATGELSKCAANGCHGCQWLPCFEVSLMSLCYFSTNTQIEATLHHWKIHGVHSVLLYK